MTSQTKMAYLKTKPSREFFGHLTAGQCCGIRKDVKPTFGNFKEFNKAVNEQAAKYGVHRRYILRAITPY